MPTVPVLTLPLRVRGNRFIVAEQGEPAALCDQAEVVLRTRPGTLEAQPDMGLRDLVARLDPASPEILSALERYVPADFTVTEELAERVRTVAVSLAE